jgi:hypothetical protein
MPMPYQFSTPPGEKCGLVLILKLTSIEYNSGCVSDGPVVGEPAFLTTGLACKGLLVVDNVFGGRI